MGAKRSTITVHRSEEVLPGDAGRHLHRQSTSVSSEGEGAAGGAAGAGGAGAAAPGAPPDPLEGADTERLDTSPTDAACRLVNGGEESPGLGREKGRRVSARENALERQPYL